MPAALPGSTLAQNLANPSAGQFVIFDPLSGPKGSPLDKGSAGTASTGALSTGIGFGANDVFGALPSSQAAIFAAGFNDNDIPGEVPTYSASPPPGVVASSAINSTRMYIGGGRSSSSGSPNPYTAGIALCGAGNSASRDGGAGPAFTGFPMKTVTATGSVANGAAIETNWTNRSGKTLTTGQSAFGSGVTVLAAAS
jgi:hypothetical protein